MRAVPSALLLIACAGCATTPPAVTHVAAPAPVVAATAAPAKCAPPARRQSTPSWCDLPADVRGFVDDRDTCEALRTAPWPASDGEADRRQRQAIVEGMRTSCAGLQPRLVELRQRYADDATATALLATYRP